MGGSPAKHVTVVQQPPLQIQPPILSQPGQQQYVPVSVVEPSGRQMLLTVCENISSKNLFLLRDLFSFRMLCKRLGQQTDRWLLFLLGNRYQHNIPQFNNRFYLRQNGVDHFWLTLLPYYRSNGQYFRWMSLLKYIIQPLLITLEPLGPQAKELRKIIMSNRVPHTMAIT